MTRKFEGRIYHAPELDSFLDDGSGYYQAKIAKSFSKFIAEAQSGKPVKSGASEYRQEYTSQLSKGGS